MTTPGTFWLWCATPSRAHVARCRETAGGGVAPLADPRRPAYVETLCGLGPRGATRATFTGSRSAPECRACWRYWSALMATADDADRERRP